MKNLTLAAAVTWTLVQLALAPLASAGQYPIVDTGQEVCYGNQARIDYPKPSQPFYGQDAQYAAAAPSYRDNGDGTVTDLVTGLMWQKDPGDKVTWAEAMAGVEKCTLGGRDDWRMPTIKELYSLIDFSGMTGFGEGSTLPYINTRYFVQRLGNTRIGERFIDAQTWSSTQYVGTTMNGDETVFGVNFIDGRIKGYPKYKPRSNRTVGHRLYARYVRGNPDYGKSDFVDNGDGTVTDRATGLTWQKADDGVARDWQAALAYAEALELAGHGDWRLPNAKELQSIVDYTRAPDVTGSPAIDPLFSTTEIRDPEGNPGQHPNFWTGTTHLDGPAPGAAAVYVAFGEAQGYMRERLLDVHGAGAQRSDPKTGDPDDYPAYHGPQGDIRYVFNHVRCVRGGVANSRLKPSAEAEARAAGAEELISPSRPPATGRQWAERLTEPGLPNLHRLTEDLYRGAQPTAEGMRRLEEMGMKTVVNLRSLHSDRDELAGTGLAYEHIHVSALRIKDEEVLRFLKIVADQDRAPVFVHCHRGADRTGLMCAVYRVAVCGWTKEEAIREMREGGFGFHRIHLHMVDYLKELDMEEMKRRAGLAE